MLKTNNNFGYTESPTCPPDKPLVYCIINPCQVTSCPAHPGAICIPDYCGGCNARFFDKAGNEVTKSCGELIFCSVVWSMCVL